jgi:hypothetical protein
MVAGTGGAGDYAGVGGDSEVIGEVLGGGGDNDDGGCGDDNSNDIYVDAESRNSRESIMLALASIGKHLLSHPKAALAHLTSKGKDDRSYETVCGNRGGSWCGIRVYFLGTVV